MKQSPVMSIPDFPDETGLERYKEKLKAEEAVNSWFAERYYLAGILNLTLGAPLGFLFGWAMLGFWWGVGMAALLGGIGLLLMLAAKPHRSDRRR